MTDIRDTRAMNNEELLQVESSQRQHHEVMLHQDRQFSVVQAAEYNLFSLLKPKLYQDGNQWCVHYGGDFPEGITGFGETPYLAVLDWTAGWNKQALK